jgi:hypothetical protein
MPKELMTNDFSAPELGLFAAIIERADGGPMRTAANVSQKRAVGRYASQKNGRGQFWESRNELHGFYTAEVNPKIVQYRAQPHTLEMAIGSKICRYTPDREDIYSDRAAEIVEIKNDYDAKTDPDYHHKLEVAEAIYRSRGKTFRIIERAEIEAQPKFQAVECIQSLRRTVVTQHDEDRVRNRLASATALPMAEIRSLWGSPVLGFAKMCALMVRRIIEIELNAALSDSTPVRLMNA